MWSETSGLPCKPSVLLIAHWAGTGACPYPILTAHYSLIVILHPDGVEMAELKAMLQIP